MGREWNNRGSMILSTSTYVNQYFLGSSKEFSKLFKYQNASSIYMIVKQLDILLNALHQEKKRKKKKN